MTRKRRGAVSRPAICGSEIANSIPKAARANPFEPLNGILGPHGDRWAALNCIVQLFSDFGAASNQIGKTYAYFESMNQETSALLMALKQSLDPDGLMNPGALGLPGDARPPENISPPESVPVP